MFSSEQFPHNQPEFHKKRRTQIGTSKSGIVSTSQRKLIGTISKQQVETIE